jgi:hypothetical protein
MESLKVVASIQAIALQPPTIKLTRQAARQKWQDLRAAGQYVYFALHNFALDSKVTVSPLDWTASWF